MNSESQSLLCSLRLLGALPQGQWIITSRTDGILNINGFCCNTAYNHLCLTFSMDGWAAAHECLKSIYCERLPVLVGTLLEKDEKKDLENIREILNDSLQGLDNISGLYDDKLISTHISSIKQDYAKSLLHKIDTMIKSNDFSTEDNSNRIKSNDFSEKDPLEIPVLKRSTNDYQG